MMVVMVLVMVTMVDGDNLEQYFPFLLFAVSYSCLFDFIPRGGKWFGERNQAWHFAWRFHLDYFISEPEGLTVTLQKMSHFVTSTNVPITSSSREAIELHDAA